MIYDKFKAKISSNTFQNNVFNVLGWVDNIGSSTGDWFDQGVTDGVYVYPYSNGIEYDSNKTKEEIFWDMIKESEKDVYPISDKFPPSNVTIDSETKDLYIFLAIAGYEKIPEVSFENDSVVVSLDLDDNIALKSSTVFLKKGIKDPAFKVEFPVPERLYYFDKTEASIEKGLLRIFIPAKPEAKPKKIKVDVKE